MLCGKFSANLDGNDCESTSIVHTLKNLQMPVAKFFWG